MCVPVHSITSTIRITMLQRRKSTVLLSVLFAVSLGLTVTDACPTFESCILNFRQSTSTPDLDGPGICLASKVFLVCVDDAEVKCGYQANGGFQRTVSLVRTRFNETCGAYTDLIVEASTSGGNACPALTACRDELVQGIRDAVSLYQRCRVHGKYVACARGAAETCGVSSDPAVAASLGDAENQYRSLCADVKNTTTTPESANAKDTVTTPEPIRVTRQALMTCSQLRECHSALTVAMQSGDVAALCKSMADFETCTEESKKTCNISAEELGNALTLVKDHLASPACKEYVQPRVGESLGSATELPMSDASSSITDIPMADASYNPTNNPKRSLSGQGDGGQQGCGGVQQCIMEGDAGIKAAGRDSNAICRALWKTNVCIQNAMENCASTTQEKEMAKYFSTQFKEFCSDMKVESPQTTASTLPRAGSSGQSSGGLDPNCADLENCFMIETTSVIKEDICKTLEEKRECTLKVAKVCSQQLVIERALSHIQEQEAKLCGVTTPTTTTAASTTTSPITTPTTPMPETEAPQVTQTPDNKANSQNEAREVSSWGGISSAPSRLLTSPMLLLCCIVLALLSL